MIAWPDGLADWGAAAESFARTRLPGHADRHADPAFGPLLAAMAEVGFTDLCASPELDGLGQDPPALARVLEPLAAADPGAAAAVYAHAAAHLALRRAGTDPPWAAASGWLAWPAFHDRTEYRWPRLTTRTHLHGPAPMLLPGAHAGHAVLPAQHPDGGTALVLADLTGPGARRDSPVRTLGLRAAGIVDASFDTAPVTVLTGDATALLDDLAADLAVAATAMLCGVMRAAARTAHRYAHERTQGGGPIIGWGEVRRLLSIQQEQLTTAQALLSAALHTDPAAAPAAARYGALHAGDLACALTTDGVQLLGGNGYMADYGQERRMRDARQLHGLAGGVAWRRQRLLTLLPAPAPAGRRR